jgi:ferritin
MVAKKIEEALSQQFKYELESYYLYRSMVNYFHWIKLKGMAQWMNAQACDEQGHVMLFLEHLKKQGSQIQPIILNPQKVEWASPLEAFDEALLHERFITGKIDDLVKLAAIENDNPTAAILYSFTMEQVATESAISKIVHTLKKLDTCGSGLELLDQQLGARNKQNIYYLNFPKATVIDTKPFSTNQ